jgi:predicted kinase
MRTVLITETQTIRKRVYFSGGVLARETKRRKRGKRMSREIPIAPRTLIVLCGPAGAGKSTFAQQYFEPTQVVSSDHCRALICDGDRTQNVDPDLFELFRFLIRKRLKLGRLTVADSTALYDFARRQLLDLAREANSHTCLLVFTVPCAVCLQRDQHRPRHVGEVEIIAQDALLQEALQHIPQEPWEQIHVLSDTDAEVHFRWQTNSEDAT